MKKNVIFRIAAIVLMCTLVTACFASSTFARYTSGVQADKSSLTVAKWFIKYDGKDLNASPAPAVTFNLLTSRFDNNVESEEGNVVAGKIAPGTSGAFTIAAITNESEVDADVAVTVKALNANSIPVKFYPTLADAKARTNEITVAVGSKLVEDTLNTTDHTATTAKTIYWVWDISSNTDTADTALGTSDAARAGTLTYDITLEVTATQVD